MSQTIITHSADETQHVGELLAATLSACVVAFTGDLGAGKTTFIQGMCRGIGYTGEVSSPTFAIVHEYLGGKVPMYHFDMYRVETMDDLYACGFFDYLDQGILAIEWSENIGDALPEGTVSVHLAYGENLNDRIITIERGEKTC